MTPASAPGWGRRGATVLVAALLGGAASAAPVRSDGFGAFWSRFRAAALAGDVASLQRMTKLPLPVGFDSDQDTVRRISAAQFGGWMRTELRCPGYLTGTTVADMRADVRADNVRDMHDARRATVGVFEFEHAPAGWRLSFINYGGPESMQARLNGRCD